MTQLVLEVSDDVARAVARPGEELAAQVRLMAALKLFELGRLSSGKAAELAGLSRAEFIDACGVYRVPVFNYAPDEVEAELERDVRALRTPEP